MEDKFNENSILGEILKFPGAEKILEKHQLPCLHCPMAKYELHALKLGEVAKVYGIDLKKVLKELNELAEKKKK